MQKNKFLIAYMGFLIFCILTVVYQGNSLVEKFGEDLYGTTTDDVIELNEDTDVSVDLVLRENALRGISVKFQTEDKFYDEKMKVSLYDTETGKFLVEDSVMLKYERIQNKDGGSYIYFSLPQSNMKNKHVRLIFSMEGRIKSVPSLVVSDNKVNVSELTVSDKQVKKHLVFKTRYYLGNSSNWIKAIADGIFLYILGTILFFFTYRRKYQECSDSDLKKIFHRENPKVKKVFPIVIKKREIFLLLFILLFLSFYIIYVYRFSVSGAIKETGYFFLKSMYAVFGVLILMIAMTIAYMCIQKKKSLESLYIPIALSLGVLFSLVICLDTVPDEPSHVDTAYAVSNEIMHIPESEKPGYIYKRAEDMDSDAEERQSLNIENYKWVYQNLFRMVEDEELVECSVRSNLGNGGRIYYIPQALGISVGRLLGLGMLPTMMLGRFFSLVCYVLLVYMAIRKVPVGKLSLFLIGILPISLQQAASMSYDGMINAVAIVFLSYNVYAFYGENKPQVLEVVIISLTGSLLATVKGGTYIPLCFLPLMLLWTRKDWQKWEKVCALSLTGIFLFAFAKERLLGTITRLSADQGAVIGGSKSKEIYTFGYILKRPVRLVGLYVNSIHKQGSEQLRNLFGGNLAWRDINIDWYLVVFIIILILLSCIRQEKEKYISRLDKVYMGILAFGCYCLIELSMLLVWTPVSFNYITGAQGRYFIPFLFLVLLCLRNSFFTIKKNIERQIIFLFSMVNIVITLQVVLIALE